MKFLVYIPCHSDLELAIAQAKKLRTQFGNSLIQSSFPLFKLKIILSVNAYSPTAEEIKLIESLFDRVIYNGVGYLGDLNISIGFLVALDEKPDIFWILSSNDYLVENALSNVMNEYINNPSIDLLVTSIKSNENVTETQIIDPPKYGYSYGLISGVIYRLEKILPYFHNGPFMAFTGWAQLAVVQSAMDSLNGLNVKYIPFDMVYKQKERELIDISKYYAHSTYGMLILGLSFKSSKIEAKKFVIKYVFKNFYKWHLFNRKWKYPGQLIIKDNYLAWNQLIAEALIKHNSIIAYYLYRLFRTLPFEVAYKVKFFMFLKRKFDALLKQPSPVDFK